ncbi:DEAD/DEAH box helicase family protein [Myxococcus qinghaiensis]|uniref:DEAD/DEAH box helicase family protein n=1 Tax=Myxococcus qinghaiensis TaxID=2906758 RepID=UPI0020A7DCD1|nr:DEAD/DEAH box helicase family protein [Myxococcus qinghaiensis]MCP3162637.1 DEAD/DEAH box helicase [Myxococcus qinghaiensis]
MKKLAHFQEAAVERIFERLTAREGSRRFLLADEVGLGKTIIARGVIERFLERNPNLNVVYLCSNAEIGEQNREKLAPGAARAVRRVTELARTRGGSRGGLRLYTFTPGTSLSEGTGMKWERQLLLYLLHRTLRSPAHLERWREFFRCGAQGDDWQQETRPRVLVEAHRGQVPLELQSRLRNRWRSEQLELDELADLGRFTLADVLATEVERFRRGGGDTLEGRRRRNVVVARLRGGLQREALAYLKPDLLILDEVQRFREVLKMEHDPSSVARPLFERRDCPTLVLSATPYRLLTLSHEETEGGGHYEDFLDTIAFLQRLKAGERPVALQEKLGRFAERLASGAFLKGPDDELRRHKDAVQEELRQVVSRTERNWYIEGVAKGVQEVLPEAGAVEAEEIADYLRLRRFLLDKAQSSFHITDYWKSAPAVLTFLDARYAVQRHALEAAGLTPGLIVPRRKLHTLTERSGRLRTLARRVFDPALGPPSDYLWTAPAFRYWRGGLFEQHEGPRKFLVFSHWRFAPKALSILLSARFEKDLKVPEDARPPLRFAEGARGVFTVCLPSPTLARAVNLAELAAKGPLSGPEAVLVPAREALRELLSKHQVEVAESGPHRLWQVVARLESSGAGSPRFREAFEGLGSLDGEDGEALDSLEGIRDEFIAWMDESGPLRISERTFERLVHAACFSPAVSLARALDSIGRLDMALDAGLLRLCFGPLRRYFNRPLVQAVIDRASDERFYPDRVLAYAQRGHLQAVLDEYVYLLDEQSGDKLDDLLGVLERVFTLSRGSPTINATTRRGRDGLERISKDPEVVPTQFAVAFGDERGEDEDAGGTSRKTSLRVAFNSPFWPFVLATTSVGQEGLDFHLYCQDIVHWNLPSNPVDLEQREGRINRRSSLAVRRSIAGDWPLERVWERVGWRREERNVWLRVFKAVEAAETPEHNRHGLFPHWIYASRRQAHQPLRRHLVFPSVSEDAARYSRLKVQLSLYRLVFGQPRQADLLERLKGQLEEADAATREELLKHLPRYMINLSPVRQEQAERQAEAEVSRILQQGAGAVRQLVTSVQQIAHEHSLALSPVSPELEELLKVVAEEGGRVSEQAASARLTHALVALAYLRNPYDADFDFQGEFGFQDDIEVIRKRHQQMRSSR